MQTFLTQLAEKTKENTEQTKKLSDSVASIAKVVSNIDKKQEKQDKKTEQTNSLLENLKSIGEKQRQDDLRRARNAQQRDQRAKADSPIAQLKKSLSTKEQNKKGGLFGGILDGIKGFFSNFDLGGFLKNLAIGGVIGTALYNYFTDDEFREKVNSMFVSIKDTVVASFNKLKEIWEDENFQKGLKAVGSFLKTVAILGVESIDKFFTGIGKLIEGDFLGAIGDLVTSIPILALLIAPKSVLMLGFKALTTLIPKLVTGLTGFAKTALPALSGLGPKLLPLVKFLGAPALAALAGGAALAGMKNFAEWASGMEDGVKSQTSVTSANRYGSGDVLAERIQMSLEKDQYGRGKSNPQHAYRTKSEGNEFTESAGLTTAHMRDTKRQEFISELRQLKIKEDEENKKLRDKYTTSTGTSRGTRKTINVPQEEQEKLTKKYDDKRQDVFKRYEEIFGELGFKDLQRRQTGGPLTVPGFGSGDKVPMMLPTGSFVLNRNASQYLQTGGEAMVPTMLEPGEKVFGPGQWDKSIEQLNKNKPRFGLDNRSSNGAPSEDKVKPQGYIKGGKIFLHWAGSGYSGAHPNYHATIQGDGSVSKTRDYNQVGGGHTHLRNNQGIGISLAAMQGASDKNFGSFPVKPNQYDSMAKLVAQIAQSRQWNANDINVNNVMTHAEAASGKDGQLPGNDNYGPQPWGGDGARWDLWKLYEKDPNGSGGEKIRSMIKSHMDYKDYEKGKKYKTGDIVKKNGMLMIFDGFGWAEYKPGAVTSQGTVEDTLNSIVPGFTPSHVPGKPTDNTNQLSGLMGMFSGLGFLGSEFMSGFSKGLKEGWEEEAKPGTNAYKLQQSLGGTFSGIQNFIGSLFGGFGGGDSGGDSGGSGDTTTTETPSGPVAPLTGDLNAKAKSMYDYMISKHQLTPAQAKGIIANIHRESTFNAKVRSGDDGGPGGLFQWKGSRQTPTVAALVNSGDWKGQIDYALKEDVGPQYKSATAGMNAFDASMWWAEKWERPASLQNARNKHSQFLPSYKFQRGGMVPTLLEPGEKVFMPGQWDSSIESLNNNIPRFQSGGAVNLQGYNNSSTLRSANAAAMDQSVTSMIMQPVVINNGGGSGGSVSVSSGDNNIPHLSDTPSNSFAANLIMTRNILSENIGG